MISVDRPSRALLPLRFRRRFNVRVCGLAQNRTWRPGWQVLKSHFSGKAGIPASSAIPLKPKTSSGWRRLLPALQPRRSPGQVLVYNQDLKNLADIPDSSLDAVVAVSALEHNTPEGLQQVVAELMRVLKPGGKLIATLSAAPTRTGGMPLPAGGATAKPACAGFLL